MPALQALLRQLLMKGVALPRLNQIRRLEDELAQRPHVVGPAASSPERFEIIDESLKLDTDQVPLPGFPRSLPHVLSSIRNIKLSLRSVADNPANPRTRVEDGYLNELCDYAHEVGIDCVGFARVPARYVFRDKAVLYENAVVLAMEMDKRFAYHTPVWPESQAGGGVYEYRESPRDRRQRTRVDR